MKRYLTFRPDGPMRGLSLVITAESAWVLESDFHEACKRYAAYHWPLDWDGGCESDPQQRSAHVLTVKL